MRATAATVAVLLLAGAAGCHHHPLATNGGGGADAGAGADGGGPAMEGACVSLPPVPRRIWRLSMPQVAASVRDLLGLPAAPELAGVGGPAPTAFYGDDTPTIDSPLAQALDAAFDQILADAAARIPALAACQPGEADDACAARFARDFGARAFRRPLAVEEVADLMTVYAEGRKQDFPTGIATMIAALLHAPSFLFRSELGAGTQVAAPSPLTAYEIASQLSYTLLDSTPDQALLDAAAAGRLDTVDGTAAEVDRLLATDAGRANATRIVADWLGARGVLTQTKDPSLSVPASDQPALESDLYASALRLVDDTLFGGGGPVTALLTTDRLVVNQRLATLYGLPFGGAAPEDFVPVPAPAGQRAGMLTHPAVIWGASGATTTSIVHRGMLVRDAVVCADAPPPPPTDLETSPSVVAETAALATEIARSDYRLAHAQCAVCHAQIDPYGRILEGLDPIGRPRTTADGAPVDATGDFSSAPPLAGRINGPAAFAGAVVADHQLAGCAALKISGYVLGRAVASNATCEVRAVRDAFEHAGGTARALFEQTLTAPFARSRAP